MFTVGQQTTTTSFIRKNIINNIKKTTEASERLSSGKRVIRASDDPGRVGEISRVKAGIGSISQAITTGGQAKTLTQAADSGLNEINNLLSRIRELAVQGVLQLLLQVIELLCKLRLMLIFLKLIILLQQ